MKNERVDGLLLNRMLARTIIVLLFAALTAAAKPAFVSVKGHQLYLDGHPYYFIGANYWYGSLLGLEKDQKARIGSVCVTNSIF